MKADSQISLIVGLGNPGAEYVGTRHNAGFSLIDRLLGVFPQRFTEKEKFSSIYWEGRFAGRTLLLQKPMTYMNVSGKAVAPLMRKHELQPGNLLLVYDDMDLPIGRVRIRKKGGSAGHNGVQSVIEHIGTDSFPRLRIGIGRSDNPTQIDHVLSEFSSEEKAIFDKIMAVSTDAVKLVLKRGVSQAMNEVNGVDLTVTDDADEENETQNQEPAMEDLS